MFYAGLACLPWLWIVNVLFFWDQVYGRVPCCGSAPESDANIANASSTVEGGLLLDSLLHAENDRAGEEGQELVRRRRHQAHEQQRQDQGQQETALVPPATSSSYVNDTSRWSEDEMIRNEVSKWVKRSTFGSVFMTSIFVAWVITFQLNRDSFGPKWFVMAPDEGESTGW